MIFYVTYIGKKKKNQKTKRECTREGKETKLNTMTNLNESISSAHDVLEHIYTLNLNISSLIQQ
jgi:hypothetical protein